MSRLASCLAVSVWFAVMGFHSEVQAGLISTEKARAAPVSCRASSNLWAENPSTDSFSAWLRAYLKGNSALCQAPGAHSGGGASSVERPSTAPQFGFVTQGRLGQVSELVTQIVSEVVISLPTPSPLGLFRPPRPAS
jgi:hypothetical protein